MKSLKLLIRLKPQIEVFPDRIRGPIVYYFRYIVCDCGLESLACLTQRKQQKVFYQKMFSDLICIEWVVD